MRAWDTVHWNFHLKETHGDAFLRIFDRSLAAFFHPFRGFDALKFDTWLNPGPDRSTYEVAKERYGQEAVDILKALLQPMPRPDPVPTWTKKGVESRDLDGLNWKKVHDFKIPLTDGTNQEVEVAWKKAGIYVHKHGSSTRITSRDGVYVIDCAKMKTAKMVAGAITRAVDTEKMSFRSPTPEQFEAIKWVAEWRNR